jgi:predicted transcriptional regulator
MAVGDLHARLQAEHRWAYSTVKTLVRRLVSKGWITYRRVGNSFLYEPAVSRSEAVRSEIKRFSDRVLGGLLSPFVAYYAERGDLTDEDVAELERILEQYREERGQEP